MPRQRKPKEDPTPTLSGRNNALIRVAISLVGFAIVVALLFSIKTTATDMLVHTQDRPNAIIKILKECADEVQQRGLKNADAMKYSDECSKQKIAGLDSKR